MVRRWAEKFGRDFANKIRHRAPQLGDKWYLDEVVITINGKKHWRLSTRTSLHFLDPSQRFGGAPLVRQEKRPLPPNPTDGKLRPIYGKLTHPESNKLRVAGFPVWRLKNVIEKTKFRKTGSRCDDFKEKWRIECRICRRTDVQDRTQARRSRGVVRRLN